MSQPTYKKQQLRKDKLSAPSASSDSAALGALAAKVLARPELYPDEFKAWLPRFINQSVNLSLSISQLPAVEAMRVVGAQGQPAFQNGWVNFGGVDAVCSFYKDPWGIVHVKGTIKSGTASSIVFTLPAGYRPQHTEFFAIVANGAFGYCTVTPAGDVTVVGSTTYTTISGITFRAYA